MIRKLLSGSVIILTVAGCEMLQPPDDGIPRVRNQADVDAYNTTVSAESDQLVCTRERVVGSNIPQFVCLTVGQRDRLREQAVEDVQQLIDELGPAIGN